MPVIAEFYNGFVMKTLNVHISGSNDPIDFPFTGGAYHVIRCLYTGYFRNLKFFINLVFLKYYGMFAFYGPVRTQYS